MIMLCAWCLPEHVVLDDDGVPDGRVGHGMCEKHLAQWKADLKLLKPARLEEAQESGD
jgi:hypothetical protein